MQYQTFHMRQTELIDDMERQLYNKQYLLSAKMSREYKATIDIYMYTIYAYIIDIESIDER